MPCRNDVIYFPIIVSPLCFLGVIVRSRFKSLLLECRRVLRAILIDLTVRSGILSLFRGARHFISSLRNTVAFFKSENLLVEGDL